jgi:hypothetical protein
MVREAMKPGLSNFEIAGVAGGGGQGSGGR